MQENSDWEPLPADRLGLHPGELAIPAPGAEVDGPDAGEPSADDAGAPRPAPAPDPDRRARQRAAMKAAFARLQARAGAGPSKDTLVRALLDKDRRHRRRTSAVQSERLRHCVVAVSDLEEADVPLPVTYSAGTDGRDPREDEAWFQELPEAERHRLAAAWADKRAGDLHARRWNPRKLQRALVHGLVVMLVAALFVAILGAGAVKLGVFVLLGTLGSGVAQLCGGGRFTYALVGMLAFFLAFAREVLGHPIMLYGAVLTAYLLGVIGLEDEMRRSGGFDDRQRHAR